MGGNRYNFDHPKNQPENLRLMHRNCHIAQDEARIEEHRKWRDDS